MIYTSRSLCHLINLKIDSVLWCSYLDLKSLLWSNFEFQYYLSSNTCTSLHLTVLYLMTLDVPLLGGSVNPWCVTWFLMTILLCTSSKSSLDLDVPFILYLSKVFSENLMFIYTTWTALDVLCTSISWSRILRFLIQDLCASLIWCSTWTLMFH
jgi:hypothetical protein